MASKTFDPPVDGGAPPLPPVDMPAFDVDEGPMRSELRRQIAALERELAAIVARSCPWEPRQVNTPRGPAVQSGAGLEEIRDELLAELHKLCRRIEGAVEPAPEPEVAPRKPASGSDDDDGRRLWRRLTRR